MGAKNRVYDLNTYFIYSFIMEYNILWNSIELLFNEYLEWERYIENNFDFSSNIIVLTFWITDILHFKDEEWLRIAQQIIFNDIITKIKKEAETKKLDFMQVIIINWDKCLLIDNWNDICLMASWEY